MRVVELELFEFADAARSRLVGPVRLDVLVVVVVEANPELSVVG